MHKIFGFAKNNFSDLGDKARNLMKKLMPKNKKMFLVLFALVIIFSGVLGWHASAEWGWETLGEYLLKIISWIFYYLAVVLAWIVTKLFGVLIVFLSFNDFLALEAVEKAWIISRDICNMFFVVILLVIAFANILRIENYSMAKTLPKLIFAAVVVNFSKLICILIIDAGQVVMLTFVAGFQAVSAYNLIVGLNLDQYLNADSSGPPGSMQSAALSIILANFFLFLTGFVVVLLLSIVVARIIALWILIILSPFAFAMDVLPGTKKYAAKWWNRFIGYVMVGPLIAFFLWFALLIMSNTQDTHIVPANVQSAMDTVNQEVAVNEGTSEASKMNNMARFFLALGMLFGAYEVTKEVGGIAGGIGVAVKGSMGRNFKKFTGIRKGTELYKGYKDKAEEKRKKKAQALTGKVFDAREKVVGIAKKPVAVVGAVAKAPFAAPFRAIKGFWQAPAKRKEAEEAVIAAGGGATDAAEAGQKAAVESRLLPFTGPFREAIAGWRSAGEQEKAGANRKVQADTDEEKKKLEESGASKEKLSGILHDDMISLPRRMASAMILGSKRQLTAGDKAIIQTFRRKTSSNPVLGKSLDENVAQKQPEHFYNFDITADIEKLAQKLKQRSVKVDDFSESALRDQGLHRAMKQAFGGKGYQAMIAKRGKDDPSMIPALLAGIRSSMQEGGEFKVTGLDAFGHSFEDAANAYAGLSGDVIEAFRQGSVANPAAQTINYEEMGKFIKKISKSDDFDKLDIKKIEDHDAATGTTEAQVRLVANLNMGVVKKAKNEDAKERVVRIVEEARPPVAGAAPSAAHSQVLANDAAAGNNQGARNVERLATTIDADDILRGYKP